MTFEEWKIKHDDEIVNVATVFFNYERGVDTRTCYDELEWLLRKAFISGQNHCNYVHTDNSKVIEELANENAELKELNEALTNENNKMIKGLGCETCQIHIKFVELNNRITELEKENAELKGLKDVATLIRANNDTVITLMQLKNMLVSKKQQLTKAKEIIKKLYLHVFQGMGFMELNDYNFLKAEAEQFLKEVLE